MGDERTTTLECKFKAETLDAAICAVRRLSYIDELVPSDIAAFVMNILLHKFALGMQIGIIVLFRIFAFNVLYDNITGNNLQDKRHDIGHLSIQAQLAPYDPTTYVFNSSLRLPADYITTPPVRLEKKPVGAAIELCKTMQRNGITHGVMIFIWISMVVPIFV